MKTNNSHLIARLSWRAIKREKFRSALITILIALPVFTLVFGSVVINTSDFPNDTEKLESELFGFDGIIVENQDFVSTEGVYPNPRSTLDSMWSTDLPGGEDTAIANYLPDEVTPLGENIIPEGVSATKDITGYARIKLGNDVHINVDVVVTDYSNDQYFEGQYARFVQVEGQRPADNTVAMSPRLQNTLKNAEKIAERKGQDLGAPYNITISPLDESQDFAPMKATLEGALIDRSDYSVGTGFDELVHGYGTDTIYLDANSDLAEVFTEGELGTTWYLTGDVPKDYATVLSYHNAGHTALFRPVAESVPPEVQSYIDLNVGNPLAIYPGIFVMFLLALAEVGILAGVAFAISARKQRRSHALLSINGAKPATLRRATGLSGLWLGLIGGIGGATAGILTAIGWLLFLRATTISTYSIKIPWVVVIVTVALAILTSVIAAWIPAAKVASQDAWSAIRGGVPALTTPRRGWFLTGVILTVLGVMITVVISFVTSNTEFFGTYEEAYVGSSPYSYYALTLLAMLVTLLGIALTYVGLVLVLPMLIHWFARRFGRGKLSLRLAARDADRNRTQTVAVTVANMTATALAVAMLMSATYQPDGDIPGQTYGPENKNFVSLYDYEEGKLNNQQVQQRINSASSTLSMVGGTKVLDSWTSFTPEGCSYPEQDDEGCFRLGILSDNAMDCPAHVLDSGTLYERNQLGAKLRESCHEELDYAYDANAGLLFADDAPSYLWGGDEAATEAFESGKAVILDHRFANDTLEIGVFQTNPYLVDGLEIDEKEFAQTYDFESVDDIQYLMEEQGSNLIFLWEPERSIEVPAVKATPNRPLEYVAVLPTQYAEQADINLVNTNMSLQLDGSLKNRDQVETELSLQNIGLDASYDDDNERELWVGTALLALVLLTITGVTVALSMSSRREEQLVLQFVGAKSTTRKNLAAAAALFTSGLGTVLGVGLGAFHQLVDALVNSGNIGWLPWAQILALGLGLPLIIAGVTWLIVPAKLPVRLDR